MTTKRETILAALRSSLTGTVGVGTRIYRSRVEPIARQESPAIVIEPVIDEPALQTHLATIDWTLRVRFTIIVRGNTPDQLADPIIEDMHSKLMTDPTIGGRAIDILPLPTRFNFVEADGPAGEIACDYRVMYRTQLANLTS